MLLSHQKTRLYEFIFIFLAVALYVVRRLLGYAHAFDAAVWVAESSNVPNEAIWSDLAGYNQYLNTIFPTIGAAVLFVSAWVLFHFVVFPKIKKEDFGANTILLSGSVVLLLVLSSFVFHYFKLYWSYHFDEAGKIVGFLVYSSFRKLFMVTNTFAGIALIGIYELIAQVYYYTEQTYQEQKQTKLRILAYSILFFTMSGILYAAIFGDIPEIQSNRGLVFAVFIILFSLFIHWAFFEKIIPFFRDFGSSLFEKYIFRVFGILVYLFIGILVYGFFRNFLHGNPAYFIPLFIAPSIYGIGSAFIRWFFFVENQQLHTKYFNQAAELSTLRSQINPHFLFNALNTLYAVALNENAEKTANGVQKLGDMMRFMLHENHQERIPLSKEVEYLQNFIEIQRMRLDESQNIEIRVNLQEPDREVYIAPMLLNPFVENAFKHGISFRKPSWIYITLTMDAQKIYFKVHNSLHPDQEKDLEQDSSGVGLENVKKRLELIYPNRYTLEIQVSEQDYFASLVLNYW